MTENYLDKIKNPNYKFKLIKPEKGYLKSWKEKSFTRLKNTKKHKKQIKEWKSQYKKYKITESYTWNLDYHFALYIYNNLIMFKKATCGYPGNYNSAEEWQFDINKMLIAFDLIMKDLDLDLQRDHEESRLLIKTGLRIFSENFQHLWW